VGIEPIRLWLRGLFLHLDQGELELVYEHRLPGQMLFEDFYELALIIGGRFQHLNVRQDKFGICGFPRTGRGIPDWTFKGCNPH
jgi:hypothetical protein